MIHIGHAGDKRREEGRRVMNDLAQVLDNCRHPGVFARSEQYYKDHPEQTKDEYGPYEHCSLCGRDIPVRFL